VAHPTHPLDPPLWVRLSLVGTECGCGSRMPLCYQAHAFAADSALYFEQHLHVSVDSVIGSCPSTLPLSLGLDSCATRPGEMWGGERICRIPRRMGVGELVLCVFTCVTPHAFSGYVGDARDNLRCLINNLMT
jgi:hypothetical protein